MDGYWIWCGSPIRAREEGRYFLFASRWPRTLTFSGHWITNSEVILASSGTPEGPYEYEKVVLPWRHRRYFDALSTHNPCVVSFDGVYYLFYTGITYDFDIPTPERQIHESAYPEHQELYREAWENKRIGLATSDTVRGPWLRRSAPLIEPRPGHWDALITGNAAVAVREDGFTVLVYKSRSDWSGSFQLGVATAPHPSGPFNRASEGPILAGNFEDPCIWWNRGRFHMVMKDFSGGLCGEPEAGAYAWSEDGIRWTAEPRFRSYSRTILWDDGTSVEYGNAERPGVLLGENGPTHLFLATSDGPRRHWQSHETRTVCIPLQVGAAESPDR